MSPSTDSDLPAEPAMIGSRTGTAHLPCRADEDHAAIGVFDLPSAVQRTDTCDGDSAGAVRYHGRLELVTLEIPGHHLGQGRLVVNHQRPVSVRSARR